MQYSMESRLITYDYFAVKRPNNSHKWALFSVKHSCCNVKNVDTIMLKRRTTK